MGKGDKKTRRGKIIMGSFGKLRPKRRKFRIRKSLSEPIDSKK